MKPHLMKRQLNISHRKVKYMNGPYVYVFIIDNTPICTVRHIEDITKLSNFVLGNSDGSDIEDNSIKKELIKYKL